MSEEKNVNEIDVKNLESTSLIPDGIKDIQNLLNNHLQSIQKQNEFKDQTINRLQKVVYQYEQGFIYKIKEPILKDLILFKDSFDKFKKRFEESSDTLLNEIDFLNDELEEIFYAHGIETISNEEDTYNRELQLIKRKIACPNPQLDKIVAEILKTGYSLDGKILRKEEVAINVYQEDTTH